METFPVHLQAVIASECLRRMDAQRVAGEAPNALDVVQEVLDDLLAVQEIFLTVYERRRASD